MTGKAPYTTQLQAGLGLIHETQSLLGIWEPGMSATSLYQAALQSGEFPNVSARRLRNIVAECFAPRYLVNDSQPALHLKQLSTSLSTADLNQLFFLYTCRANPILADFVRDVYWESYSGGMQAVGSDGAKEFIHRAMDDGKTSKRWSDTTVKRVSSYLIGACADYGLLGRVSHGAREIMPYRVNSNVAAYLVHNLHFQEVGDNALLAHIDWGLFGLEKNDVREELKQLSLKGYLIIQTAGDVTHIGWQHKSMEEFLNVLAQG